MTTKTEDGSGRPWCVQTFVVLPSAAQVKEGGGGLRANQYKEGKLKERRRRTKSSNNRKKKTKDSACSHA